MLRFKKDFLDFKEGDEIEAHPHAEYWLRVGVVEEAPEKKEHLSIKEKVEHIFSKKEKVVKKKK